MIRILQGICNFMPIIIDIFTRSLQGSCKILKDFKDLESILLKFLLWSGDHTRFLHKILEKFDTVDRIFKDLMRILTNIIARIFLRSLLGSFNILFERTKIMRILQGGEYYSNVWSAVWSKNKTAITTKYMYPTQFSDFQISISLNFCLECYA